MAKVYSQLHSHPMEEDAVIDLQPFTTTESTPETHDFGREEAMALVAPHPRDGVETAEDQFDSLIADELFTA